MAKPKVSQTRKSDPFAKDEAVMQQITLLNQKLLKVEEISKVANEAWNAWLVSRKQAKRMTKSRIKGSKVENA